MRIRNHTKIIITSTLFWLSLFLIGYYSPQIISEHGLNTSAKERGYAYSHNYGFQSAGNKFATLQASEALLEKHSQFSLTSSKSCSYEPDVIVKIDNPESLTAIVDKKHKLDKSFQPTDMVVLYASSYPVRTNTYLRSEAGYSLVAMIKEIQSQGIDVRINSGWRTYNNQITAYNYWVSLVGPIKANDFAAIPGHSEHQLGTTVDIVTSENNYKTTPEFDQTRVSKWLQENAHQYGFTLSYPKNKKEITGYGYEPWHYRYVGIDNALAIKRGNFTPIEYFYEINEICR